MFDKKMIEKYADNLLMGLSNDEINDLLSEFDVIKENMDLINNIDGLSDVKPLDFPQERMITSLRNGDVNRSIPTKEILSNSKGTFEDVIEIPKVVG